MLAVLRKLLHALSPGQHQRLQEHDWLMVFLVAATDVATMPIAEGARREKGLELSMNRLMLLVSASNKRYFHQVQSQGQAVLFGMLSVGQSGLGSPQKPCQP